MNQIELIDVKVKFGGQVLFENVTAIFEKGKIYGIVGRNGVGKSVLFKVISGFIQPAEGKVIIHSDLKDSKKQFPKEFGVLIDRPGYMANQTGFQNLKILASIQNKISDDHIRSSMVQVGLDPNNMTKVKSYSLGMKQKLAIAQAIMEDQKVLILDEPFNALDSESVKDIHALFLNLRDMGKTILITSHNQQDIDLLCDEVYGISDKKLTIKKRNKLYS